MLITKNDLKAEIWYEALEKLKKKCYGKKEEIQRSQIHRIEQCKIAFYSILPLSFHLIGFEEILKKSNNNSKERNSRSFFTVKFLLVAF